MIDIAWSEFMFIAVLALILVGPKELPTVLHYVGRWVGKMRAYGRQISDQLDVYSHFEDEDVSSITQNNEVPKDASKKAKS